MNNSTKQKSKSKYSITNKQLIAYGFGGIVPIALFNIAGQLMGLIGNISLGLSALWLGVILIIPRLWDAVSDPIVGHFSDNLRTRWGRRRPLLLIGGISVALSFVFMWWIPDGATVHSWFPTETGFKWFQLGYILLWLLIFFTACTIFEIPHGALGMEMTNDPHERTRLFSSKSFFGNLFAMSTPWLFALANMEYFKGAGGNEADGMKYVSILVALLLIPLTIWMFFTVKEPGFEKASKQEKTAFWQDVKHTFRNKTFVRLVLVIFSLAMGFNFVNLLGYYIPIYYIFDGDKKVASTLLGINGTIWAITGLLAVFPLNWVSPKLGKRKTLLLAISLIITAQLSKIVCYNHEYPYLIIIPTILLSAGMLFFFTLGSSMVGDICDEDDLKTGRRAEGSYYSIFWWFIKMGTALASLVAGLLIVITQFDETQVTKVDAYKGAVNELVKFVEQKNEFQNIEQDKLIFTVQSINDESLEYIKNLKNDLIKDTIGATKQNKSALTKSINRIKQVENNLYKDKSALQNTTISPDSLTSIAKRNLELHTKVGIEKINLKANLLSFHLQKVISKNSVNKEHYETLLQHLNTLDKQTHNLNTSYTNFENLHTKFISLKNQIKQLEHQSQYTLLMMRIVEIGLPLLLSFVSIFLLFKYPLTEKRIYEIKSALDKRNKANKKN